MKIRETLIVACPYGRAPIYLDAYLSRLERQGEGRASLRLQVPLKELGVPGGLILARDVVASFSPLTKRHTLGHFAEDEHHFEHMSAVEWAPDPGGPFPTFRGSLSIKSDEDYDACRLVLEGDYKPPLGLAGRAFDAALGRRLARSTARNLLGQFGKALEEAHRETTVPLPSTSFVDKV